MAAIAALSGCVAALKTSGVPFNGQVDVKPVADSYRRIRSVPEFEDASQPSLMDFFSEYGAWWIQEGPLDTEGSADFWNGLAVPNIWKTLKPLLWKRWLERTKTRLCEHQDFVPFFTNLRTFSVEIGKVDDGPLSRLIDELRTKDRQTASISGDLTMASDKITTERSKLSELQSDRSGYQKLRAFMVAKHEDRLYEVALLDWNEWLGSLPSNRHALLVARDTEFLSKGNFSLWVERGGTESITTKDGFVQEWPVFREVSNAIPNALDTQISSTKAAITSAQREWKASTRQLKAFDRNYCALVARLAVAAGRTIAAAH